MLTKEQYLLIQLAEECAEVSHRVSKALRFGLAEVQEGQTLTNSERLVAEIVDCVAVMDVIHDAGILDLNDTVLEAKFEEKKDKIAKYMAYSRDNGILQ